MIDGVKSAVATLKSAQAAGKELGSVVTSQQADMEDAIQREHQSRIKAKLTEEARKSSLEFRALEKFESRIRHEQEVAKLKADTIRKYGNDAWVEVEAEKAKMENNNLPSDAINKFTILLEEIDKSIQTELGFTC